MNEELRRALDDLKADLGKGSADVRAKIELIEKAAEERTKTVTELRAEIDELKKFDEERKAAIDKLQEQGRTQVLGSGRMTVREQLRVFGMMMREGMCHAKGMEIPAIYRHEIDELKAYRATLEVGAVTGSYLVPTLTSDDLIDTTEEVSTLAQMADFIMNLPGNVDIPTLVTRPTLQHARATVDTDMTESDPAFGQLQIRPDEGYVYFGVDNRLLLMSAIDLGALCVQLCRDAIMEGLSNDLLNGDGTSTYNSITGILQETTAAYIYTLASGNTAFADLDNDALVGAMNKTFKRGRAMGLWLMSLDVLGVIENLNREGKAPVLRDRPDGTYSCKNRPVHIDEGMPDLADDAADTGFLGFGDLKTYMVGLQGGINVELSTESLFAKNQTAFRSVINFDIKRKPVPTFMLVKTAAS